MSSAYSWPTPYTWPTTTQPSHRRPGRPGGTGSTSTTASSRQIPWTSSTFSAPFTTHLPTSTCTSNRPSAQRTTPHTRAGTHRTPSSHSSPPPWGEAGTIGYDRDGLTILGTEACAGRATPLHAVGAQAARQVTQRAQKATVLATSISDMIRLCPQLAHAKLRGRC